MRVRLAAILTGMVFLLVISIPATTPVSAAPAVAGSSYGCQINPNAPTCTSAPAAVTSGQSVAGISQASGGQPSLLPASGGAQSSGGSVNLTLLLAAFALLVFGLLVRKAAVFKR